MFNGWEAGCRRVGNLWASFSLDPLKCKGYRDVSVVPGYIEDTYDKIEAELCPLVEAGAIPVAMGGDHSITLPELRAIAKTHGPVAVIHFDSQDPYSIGAILPLYEYDPGRPLITNET